MLTKRDILLAAIAAKRDGCLRTALVSCGLTEGFNNRSERWLKQRELITRHTIKVPQAQMRYKADSEWYCLRNVKLATQVHYKVTALGLAYLREHGIRITQQ